MLRKGRWKLIHYVGFEPELFDLESDPEETASRGADAPEVLAAMMAELAAICDPDATDARAFADQAAMIERYGGRDIALRLGAPGATPPPEVTVEK
jgi:choline-sulfatase